MAAPSRRGSFFPGGGRGRSWVCIVFLVLYTPAVFVTSLQLRHHGDGPVANTEIGAIVEDAKSAHRACHVPNHKLQGDYLIVDNKVPKNFPARQQQDLNACNLPMLTTMATRYLQFVETICPTDPNTKQPLATNNANSIKVQILNPVGGQRVTLTKVTHKARRLSRHAMEVMKLLSDVHHPEDLNRAASLLLDQTLMAQEYIVDMGKALFLTGEALPTPKLVEQGLFAKA